MVISHVKRVKIIEKITSGIPEHIKMEKLYSSLMNDIKDACWSVLTDAEREFVTKFPNYVVPQENISLSGYEIRGIDSTFPEIGYSWDDYSRFISVKVGSGKEPFLFSTWSELKKSWPSLYDNWTGRLREIILLRKEVIKMQSKLVGVLEAKDISLRDVKNYYPGLYKIIKENA